MDDELTDKRPPDLFGHLSRNILFHTFWVLGKYSNEIAFEHERTDNEQKTNVVNSLVHEHLETKLSAGFMGIKAVNAWLQSHWRTL